MFTNKTETVLQNQVQVSHLPEKRKDYIQHFSENGNTDNSSLVNYKIKRCNIKKNCPNYKEITLFCIACS